MMSNFVLYRKFIKNIYNLTRSILHQDSTHNEWAKLVLKLRHGVSYIDWKAVGFIDQN